MAEFIGAKISLIAKNDIRFVGILVEINSETSTVALENVYSFGTEGRRPGDEIPASTHPLGSVEFKGSDVQDLRIEEPKPLTQPQPRRPQEPAIISEQHERPIAELAQRQTPSNAHQNQSFSQQRPPQPPHYGGNAPPRGYDQYDRQPQYQNQWGYPPQYGRYGGPPQHFGPPGPHMYGGMPHQPQYNGPPQGAYNNQGFDSNFMRGYGPPPVPGPGHGNYGPPRMPSPPRREKPPTSSVQHSIDNGRKSDASELSSNEPKPPATVKLPTPAVEAANIAAPKPPVPPIESKPNVQEALAPPLQTAAAVAASQVKVAPPKPTRFEPAVPIISSGPRQQKPIQNVPPKSAPASIPKVLPSAGGTEDAAREAKAAVAEAMAKLSAGKTSAAPQDNTAALTQKINAMRVSAPNGNRPTRGTERGRGRGSHRGGGRGGATRVEVPKTDFDFESMNAKFNKEDIVKEAIAGGSAPEITGSENDAIPASNEDAKSPVSATPATYNKSSSFFDNLSSEIKDRAEPVDGRALRSEERQRNMETFGQGSVDNAYRYGRAGRGRGRGRGGNPGYRGRGAPRGNRGGQANGTRAAGQEQTAATT